MKRCKYTNLIYYTTSPVHIHVVLVNKSEFQTKSESFVKIRHLFFLKFTLKYTILPQTTNVSTTMLMNGKYTALPLSIVDFWQKICEEGLLIEECCQVLFRVINQANYIAQKKRPSFIAYIVLDPLQVKCLLLNHDIFLNEFPA